MMRRFALAVLVLVAVLASATAVASAQEPAPVIVAADASAHPEVSLIVDLPRGVSGDADGLTVVEAGVPRPAEVIRGERTLEVAVVVDTSGSMTGASLVAAKAAAGDFLDRLPDGARAAVVGFGQHPYVVTPMTDDRAAFRPGVAGLVAAGETALYDALAVASSQFSTPPTARTILLISDGGDTASTKGLDEIKEILASQRVRLFGVHLLTSEAQRTVLEDLASATSGRVAAATDAAGLGSTYAEVAADVVRQVGVRYRSEAWGPTAVAVRIGDSGSVSPELALELPPEPATAPTPPAPRVVPVAGPRSLVVGGAAMFLALLLWSGMAFLRPRRSLLAASRRGSGDRRRQWKARAGEAAERALEQRGRERALGSRLENAGIALRPGEYVVMASAAVALAFVCGAFLSGVLLGLGLALAAGATSQLLLRSRTGKRRAELEKQLPDLLQQLISSLRAGYGVMQAVDAAARELEEPMSGELRRLFTEVQLGRDLTESLRALADRLSGQDFEWVVQAIEINREVGGELVEVLEAVTETIRARDHLRRQVKTLTAQGRLSARILLAMPFVMAVLLSALSPGYLSPLVTQGSYLLVVGAALMLVGWTWTRRLIRPRF